MLSQNKKYRATTILLLVLLFATALLSIRYGAVSIGVNDMFSALQKQFSSSENLSLDERIFIQIRLPRALLCVLVGASIREDNAVAAREGQAVADR